MINSPIVTRAFVRRSLMLAAASATLLPAISSARTVILANAPGTAPNGGSNTNVPATFGDNVAAAVTNIFDATAGTDGTVGTPGIDLTWAAVASPLGSTNANAWQFHTWGGATAANTGGGALQLDGSRTGSKFNVTFTPVINATVKLNSFNFVGDTNGDSYQYRVRVVRISDSQVVFTTDTASWTTATAQNPTNTEPDTWTGAPKVDINFTGTQGVAYRLEIERLNDDSAQAGSRVDIAIDNLDFDQLTVAQNDLVWTGGLSTAWTTNALAAPKNWQLTVGGAADFATGDKVTFNDSAAGNTHTVDITGADVSPGSLKFENATEAYTLTGTNGIAGNIELVKTGAGTLTLANHNSHTGRTLMTEGPLVIDHALALQNSTLEGSYGASTHAFGTITTATLGGLAGSADLELESSTNAPLALTVGGNNASTIYQGQLTGTGSLIKNGTGRLDLTFENTFTGGITVAAGSLRTQSETSFPAGTITSTGGTIEFGIASSVETPIPNNFILPVTGTGDLRMFSVFGGGGAAPSPGTTVRLTGKVSGGVAGRNFYFSDTGIGSEHDNVLIFDNATNDFTGTIFLNRATIAFTSDAALGNPDNDITHYSENLLGRIRFDADNITLNPLRAVSLPTAANSRPFDTQDFTGTIAGPISGVGTLVKQGNGKLILTSNDSTLTGAINVTAGTLQVDGTIPTSAATVTVASGTTLAGSGTLNRSVIANGTVAPGSSVGTLHGLAALTLGTSSSIAFELSDWNGVAGTGYDTITADSVAITATSAAPVTIVVTPQTLANFSDAQKSFTLVSTTTGITGFAADAFVVDASALPAATAFTWSVQVQGNNLVLVYGEATGTPFETWASSKGLTGNDALFNADPDGDGISNGIEFVLGGEPNPANPGANSAAILPTISRSANGSLVFIFRRTDAAAVLNPGAEYDTDLASTWTTAEGGVNGVVINETNDGFGAGIDRVEVIIPSSQAASGKLFARLVVSE